MSTKITPIHAQPAYTSILPDAKLREYVFGANLAFHGDSLLINSSGDSQEASYSGAIEIYVQEQEQWVLKNRIRPSETIEFLSFGRRFELVEDELFVLTRNGVYVFQYINDVWQEKQLIQIPPELPFETGFTLVANASKMYRQVSYDPGPAGFNEGAVLEYVKSDSAWVYNQLIQPQPGVGDHFGASMCMMGNLLIAGAPRDPIIGDQSGSIYIISLDDPEHEIIQKIIPPIATQGDQFGGTLACLEDRFITRSLYSEITSEYQYIDNSWVNSGTLEIPSEDRYIWPYLVVGGKLFISGNESQTHPSGQLQELSIVHPFVLIENTWTALESLSIATSLHDWERDDGEFGWAIAMNETHLAISAPFRDWRGENETGETLYLDELGEVFIFDLGDVAVATEKPKTQFASPETFTLYPNPTAGASTLALPSPPKHPVTVTVYDLIGRTRLTQQISQSTSFDLASLAAGLYFVRVCDEINCNIKSLHKL